VLRPFPLLMIVLLFFLFDRSAETSLPQAVTRQVKDGLKPVLSLAVFARALLFFFLEPRVFQSCRGGFSSALDSEELFFVLRRPRFSSLIWAIISRGVDDRMSCFFPASIDAPLNWIGSGRVPFRQYFQDARDDTFFFSSSSVFSFFSSRAALRSFSKASGDSLLKLRGRNRSPSRLRFRSTLSSSTGRSSAE